MGIKSNDILNLTSSIIFSLNFLPRTLLFINKFLTSLGLSITFFNKESWTSKLHFRSFSLSSYHHNTYLSRNSPRFSFFSLVASVSISISFSSIFLGTKNPLYTTFYSSLSLSSASTNLFIQLSKAIISLVA